MKRIISWALSIIMVLAMMPLAGEAEVYAEMQNFGKAGSDVMVIAKGEFGEGLSWSIDSDGVLLISGEGAMPDYGRVSGSEKPWNSYDFTEINIDNGITYIGEYAFYSKSAVKNIEISNSVKWIGNSAFESCSGLEAITIPGSVRNIGYSAFEGCSSLQTVIIQEGTRSIFPHAFEDCESLKAIHLPESVKEIGRSGFYNCKSLSSIALPADITKIEYDTFWGCSSLKYVELPESLKEIQLRAFYNCSSLKEISFPETLTTLGQSAFYGCISLKNIVIPGTVQTIDSNTFANCENLTSVTLEAGVTAIKGWAFACCKNMTSIIVPASVTTIDKSVFSGSNNTVVYGNTSAYIYQYAIENNIPFSCLNHTWEAEASVDQEMSCTKDRIESIHCRFCTATKDEVVTPTEGHDYEEIKSRPPTCEEPGYGEYKCKACGDTYIAEEIPALGHEIIIDEAVAATCTETGLVIDGHCRNCEYKIEQEEIPALGHKYDAGVVTKEPTEKEFGIKTFTCERCGDYFTEDIPKLEPRGVTRVYGSDRFATALKSADALKTEMGVSKFDAIIVASGTTFADALPGSYLAAKKSAPILLIDAGCAADVRAYIYENLKPGGNVYILGGTDVVPDSWLSGLSNVIRLGGSNRYETNLKILEAAGVSSGQEILVCTGTNFADSLSASATGKPILLVGSSLTDSQKTFLNSLSNEKYCMIGGSGSVSDNVMWECEALSNGYAERIAGVNRFETSVEVAKRFFKNPEHAVLAYGMNFPDGLSAGPLAYALKSPLILSQTGQENIAMTYTYDKNIRSGYVLGGVSLINDITANRIFNAF